MARESHIDIDDIFSRGGKALIDFLDYSVRSVQMDPLFVFLVQDYRRVATVVKALALYDVFCAPNSPGRIGAESALPPYDMRLADIMRTLRTNGPAPPRYLFDALVTELERNSKSLSAIRESYNPELSPIENLPGGKMTAVQRHFVDRIWQPAIRVRLVEAGFWRVSTIA